MSGKESIRNWLIIFALLILTGLVAVIWPLVVGGFGGPSGGTSVSGEMRPVTLPFAVGSITEVNGFVLVAVLTAVVVGAVVVTGAILAGLYQFLHRQTDAVKESQDYQTMATELAARDKELTQQLREGRKAGPIPDHRKLGWSALSTSLLAFFLVYAAVVVVVRSVVAETAVMTLGSMHLSTRTIIVLATLLVTILVLVWRMRTERFATIDESDAGPIPWDSLWVILTGLIVVGFGVGLLVYFNIPG